MTHTGPAHAPHVLPFLLLAGLLGRRLVRRVTSWAATPADDRRQLLLAAALAAAAATHLVATASHSGGQSWLFAVATAVQLALAGAVLAHPSRVVLVAAAVSTFLALAAWEATRTVGLPVLGREPVGWTDLVAVATEVGVLLLVGLLRSARLPARRLGTEHLSWGLVVVGSVAAAAR